jgi:hypothetical protein
MIFWMKTQAGWRETKEPDEAPDLAAALALIAAKLPG